MANRGQLTEEINAKANAFFGRDITQVEFRLLPYIDYIMKNEQKIKPTLINEDDRKFLQFLRSHGHVEGGMTGLAITKEFYDFMQEVLWIGYIAYSDGKDRA